MTMTASTITFVFDAEITQAWRRLYTFEKRPFSEFMKEAIVKETLKHAAFQVTVGVNALIGTLPTTLEYHNLREQMIEDYIADYENLP